MSDVIDLDALVPNKVTIKIDNQEIEVMPPKMADMLMLTKAGGKLKDIDNLEAEEIERAVESIRDGIYKLIPALTGKELSIAQLLKLVEIINDMTIPPDAAELSKRGIAPDSPKAP